MVLQYNKIWKIYELHIAIMQYIAIVQYIAINSNMNILQFKSIYCNYAER